MQERTKGYPTQEIQEKQYSKPAFLQYLKIPKKIQGNFKCSFRCCSGYRKSI